MDFADSYFEDEVREGFYVPSIMKKAWAAQLEVLYTVQQLCKKHNIRYFAEWGTLLGATRHGGMIPWDDDFDICMLSEEYNRFLKVADELPDGFSVSEYHTNDSDNMVVRVNNSEKLIVGRESLEQFHGFPYYAGVDIFRLDYLPADGEEQKNHHEMVLLIGAMIGLAIDIENEEDDTEELEKRLERHLLQIEEMCPIKFDRNESIKKQLYHFLLEDVGSLFDARQAKEVTNLPVWSDNINYKLPKRCYESSVSVPFENMEIAMPVGYDELLQKKYGGLGYMNPVRMWDSHEYPYFEELKKFLVANTSSEVFEYTFDIQELEETEEVREEQRKNRDVSLKERICGFLPLFEEAHDSIRILFQNGSIEETLQLLADCQNVAVEIGTMIEEERGEGQETVSILENYCELLFHLNEEVIKVAEGQFSSDMNEYWERLRSFEQHFSNCVETQFKERKEVVFIPYKASYWKTMHGMWKAAMEDEDTDVYVIPIPYYYKDALGRVKKQDPHYEVTGYPTGVSITSYEKYNFQVHHPDTIVIQCPYDEFNYAMTVHPFFYAKNLKQYTEQLVYIPALIMDEIDDRDDRAKKVLKYYCNMPGVVNADKVIVQSEQMKKVYVELLTEFAGEDTKEIWENKILGSGLPVYAMNDNDKTIMKDLPEGWLSVIQKPDGNRKKIILYSTSASALFGHGEKMIHKMEEVFQTFQNCQDEVALIWRPDPKTREVLRRRYPGLWQKYRNLVQKYREDAWGIYDDSPDAQRAISLCDAGYGDGGTTLNACRVQKKPVMLQNVWE